MLLKTLGLSTRIIHALEKKKIYTTDDIVRILPKKYHDYRFPDAISKKENGKDVAVLCKILDVEEKSGSVRKYICIKAEDDEGCLFRIMIFGRLREKQYFKGFIDKRVVVCGKLQIHPIYGTSILDPEKIQEETRFVAGIYPVYRKIGGVSVSTYMTVLEKAISVSEELVENDIVKKTGLVDYNTALQYVHHPKNEEEIRQGRKRLVFNDLLYFALSLSKQNEKRPIEGIKMPRVTSFLEKLPYALTEDQNEVVNKLIKNMNNGIRNDVLLQGDVGCGKTIVAFIMMMQAFENGYQSALIAPRSVLAKQHYDDFIGFAEKMGAKTVYLSSEMSVKEKRNAYEKISKGEYNCIIGTHSCLGKDLEYANLGLIITDEEHLFGVSQKEMLLTKAKSGVHEISMSATPIPRSIASVLYGNSKEMLYIKTMPAGRKPIKTCICSKRDKVFSFVEKEITKGHQCYVVCPAIEDKEDSSLYSVEEAAHEYQKAFFGKNIAVGYINGKMPKEESDKVVNSFKSNELQVLISTTVIEVGVNVPNATVIIIEQAERFGLASLHQLRGRVGRGSDQSYCVLLSDQADNTRLNTMVSTTDGFLIAEADMKERGAGNLIGEEQSGLNKYVNEMLQYPNLYSGAKKVAEYCQTTGAGMALLQSRSIE